MSANHHPKCKGGRRCVCNSEIEHEHCICSDTACACHAPDAYHMERVSDSSGREYYVPQGARLVVRRGQAVGG